MIRGSIEVARRTQVSGWIYAEGGTVQDGLILAFSGERCVGAGKVDRFRKDLLDAQLGDGHCGFDFPIKLNDDEAAGSVIVKLQNSDVALIQSGARLVGADDLDEAANSLGAVAPGTVSWMQDRGWLEQHEFDFLRSVQTIGAYERGLRPARRLNAELAAPLKPEQAVRDLFSLFVLSDVDVSRTTVASISELAGGQSPMRGDGIAIAALWSPERCRIAFEERSHTRPGAVQGAISTARIPGAIEYGFGPDRVLFVHRCASFAPQGIAPVDGITVFTARLREASAFVRLRKADQAA